VSKTVIGLFDNASQANNVVQDLINAGFSRDEIGIVGNNTTGEYNSYLGDGTGTTGHSGAAESGAGAGATAGTVIGGGLGLLAGIGALAIPGFGPIVAAGWLVSTITGAGIGAALGGLVGALTGLGVPREDAEYYNEGVRRGGTLVTVRTSDDRAEQAASILSGHGAANIDERANDYRSTGYTGYNPDAQPYTADQINSFRSSYAPMATGAATGTAQGDIAPAPTANLNTTAPSTTTNFNTTPANTMPQTVTAGQEVAIPIVEEQLAVGKRQVQGGGARIHTFVEERPVSEQVSLHEERVTVDRRPVDRPLTDADAAFREGTIEVTETREVPVVSKEARVVEEVVVGKQATDRTETVQDTVRRTDVEVEQLNSGVNTTGTTGTNYGTTGTGVVQGAEHAARNAEQNVSNAVQRTEGNIPGVQTGGHAIDGSGIPDTRGITEKVADTVTGNRIDDKTGRPV
jgi:uncharacterized protein (TIGR02271 family)